MHREVAVLGEELAFNLISQGFEMIWSKEGKFTTVYYFYDTEEFIEALERLLAEV